MKTPPKTTKCLHCGKIFTPDCRNRARQKYCFQPECQRQSKRGSQQRWLEKPENRDYFRDAKNVERVRQWRQAHPGYWKRSGKKTPFALQEACPAQSPAPEPVKAALPEPPLQDLCFSQHPLLVGLISQITASALPEDIDQTIRLLIAKGRDILDEPSRRLTKGNLVYDD